MNLAQLLLERVASNGSDVAIIDNSRGKSRRFTFAEIDSAAARVAAQLRAAGLQRGDPVLLLQPVSAELYIVFVAILRCGFVAQFIDPAAGRPHLEYCCALHPPRAFIGPARAHFLRFVSPALRRIPKKFSTDLPIWGARQLDFDPKATTDRLLVDCPDDFPAMIRFTSGSTGQPKAVIRSHGYLLAQQQVIQPSFALSSGELDLVTMPMFVLANLAAGVASLLPQGNLRSPASIDPALLLRQINQHQPTRLGAAPVLLENLTAHCAARFHRLPQLKKIFTGGAPVFPRLLDQLAAVAPAAAVVAVYGSTEAEPIATLNHRDLTPDDRKRISNGAGLLAGFPDVAIQARVVPIESASERELTLPGVHELLVVPSPGVGQIVVAGPHVQPFYAGGSGHPQTPLEFEGRVWHRTGDAGYFDERGRLWLLGRCSARIKDQNGVLYPFQVEGVAREHPSIRQAALVELDGRRVLVIEPMGEIDLAELKAKFQWASIETIEAVPRVPVDARHNSKTDYPALLSLFRNAGGLRRNARRPR